MPRNPNLLQVGQVFKILKPHLVRRRDGKLNVETHRSSNDVENIADTLWVVASTEMSGGGTGHGPHDVYPDGWGVRATQVDGEGVPTGETLFFRQSGCFTNELLPEDVEVVGVATPTYQLRIL